MKFLLLFLCIFLLAFFSTSLIITADEIEWMDVSKTNNELILIDPNSVKYSSKGLLSVITKYSEFYPEDQNIINSDSYLMAVDCDDRLFSKLPINGKLKQVKDWKKPINDKLIKQAIMNICSF